MFMLPYLPKYRGGAPVHYAILNGDEKTGVTIMYMVKKDGCRKYYLSKRNTYCLR
ncbi:formyltransferase family protein [Faecalibacillus intestinalis]|uniref:formyltransferase family protein n=1 Tax=Faecalibacillus intestinalis TaxID=1982626 RepID=UPI003521FB60